MAASDLTFLRDMAVVMVAAAVTTVLFHRLRQPVVLGYILAGVLVGPLANPFTLIRDRATIEVLGQLGIVFLLFALGLEFNIAKLRKVGLTAIVAGVLETSLMVWLGYTLGRLFGFGHLEAIFLGAIVSISSTTIIVKILTEFKQKDEEWAEVIFGILIVEDVIAVLILTVLSTAGAGGDLSTFQVGAVMLKLGIFVSAALVLGLVVVPRLVGYVARFQIDEVLVVTVLGLAFAMSLLATRLGFSTALGAFIMGALIAESRSAKDVERKILPIRDLFTAIFFVTVGMLLDPRSVLANWPLVLAVSAAVIGGKLVAASFATFVSGHEPRTALRVGFGLAQIGEFSFIIATLALSLGVTDAPLYAIAVAVSAITAFTSPLLIRLAPRVVDAFEHRAPKPLTTYAKLYGAWVGRLRELARNDPTRIAATRAGIRTNLYGAALIAIVALGVVSIDRIDRALASALPEVEGIVTVAGWTLVTLAALPFLFLFTRSLRAFVRALADAALPERLKTSETGTHVQAVLRRTFFLTGVVVLGSLILVIASPFVPPLPLLLLVALGVGASGVLLYGALVRFHRRVDATLAEVITGEQATTEAREERSELLSLIREKYPWEVEAKEIRVPKGCHSANRSIRDLRLRSLTGATLVGLHRGKQHVVNPPPETVIQAGDTLILMGEDAQVSAARDLLLRPARDTHDGGPTEWREVLLHADSPWVGRTLGGTHIRARTGATVVGIVRAGGRIPNPDAAFRLAAHDVLLVMGTAAQVASVEAIARARESGAGAAGGAAGAG